jgi:phage terminase small subunit
MTQADCVSNTPPLTASEKPHEWSEIIEQCVAYMQATAAYAAGVKADDGDATHSGADSPLGNAALRSAEAALRTLVALSETYRESQRSPSVLELKAKATVCRAVLQFEEADLLPEDEWEYVSGFAREVEAYFESVEA